MDNRLGTPGARWRLFAALALAAVALAFFWRQQSAPPQSPESHLEQAAQQLVDDAVRAMPREPTLHALAVLPFLKDHDGYLRKAFAKAVALSGKYRVPENVETQGAGLSTPQSVEQAFETGRDLAVQRLLWGDVRQWGSPTGQDRASQAPTLAFSVYLLDPGRHTVVWETSLRYR